MMSQNKADIIWYISDTERMDWLETQDVMINARRSVYGTGVKYKAKGGRSCRVTVREMIDIQISSTR